MMKNTNVFLVLVAIFFTHGAFAGSAKAGAVRVQTSSKTTAPGMLSSPHQNLNPQQTSNMGNSGLTNKATPKGGENKGFNDPVVQEAMTKTQGLMQDPKQRNEAIGRDPKAKQADDMVQRLSGGDAATTNDVYALASQIFANLVQQANGDPKKMQDLIEEFKRDPASFASTWTPDQQAKLKEIAAQLENVKPQAPK